MVASEQSTGTFIRLKSETDALRARAAARIEACEVKGRSSSPSLPCRKSGDVYERGEVRISWPVDSIGASLPNLLATVAGNLFELAELSAIRLLDLDSSESFVRALPGP